MSYSVRAQRRQAIESLERYEGQIIDLLESGVFGHHEDKNCILCMGNELVEIMQLMQKILSKQEDNNSDMEGNTMSVYDEIKNERNRQDAKWGGPQHDDAHDLADFNRYIHQRLGDSDSQKAYRQRMIEIAALAIAAIESNDRRVQQVNCPECGSSNTKIHEFYAAGPAWLCLDCDHDWDIGLSAPVQQNPSDHAAGASDAGQAH